MRRRKEETPEINAVQTIDVNDLKSQIPTTPKSQALATSRWSCLAMIQRLCSTCQEAVQTRTRAPARGERIC